MCRKSWVAGKPGRERIDWREVAIGSKASSDRTGAPVSSLAVAGRTALAVAGGVDAPLYRIDYRSRLLAAALRQFPPSFRLLPGEFGQTMSLLGLLMDTLGSLPHLLGELSGSRQHAVEQGLGTRSPPHGHNLYLSL